MLIHLTMVSGLVACDIITGVCFDNLKKPGLGLQLPIVDIGNDVGKSA